MQGAKTCPNCLLRRHAALDLHRELKLASSLHQAEHMRSASTATPSFARSACAVRAADTGSSHSFFIEGSNCTTLDGTWKGSLVKEHSRHSLAVLWTLSQTCAKAWTGRDRWPFSEQPGSGDRIGAQIVHLRCQMMLIGVPSRGLNLTMSKGRTPPGMKALS